MSAAIFQDYADSLLSKANSAAMEFLDFSQEKVDAVVKAVFEAAFNSRHEFARLAYAETGIGVIEHKVIKNCWASLLVYENIKDQITVGEIATDTAHGITEIAMPHGPILALTPLTNPTSTAVFKILIALKTRNPLLFSPHGAARKCTRTAIELLYQAAISAGAPEHCIQFISRKQIDYLQHIMRHRDLALILATGTRQIVKEAYLSGKPVIGIGPGNVPVFIDTSADMELSADYIVLSKTFDNGTVCASEQALVVEKSVAEIIRPILEKRNCFFCSEEEAEKLGKVAFDSKNTLMKSEIVGKPATFLAEKAGIKVPHNTKLLIAPCQGIGPGYPLSYEILTPILTYYTVKDYAAALNTCIRLNQLGGQGHTVSIYTNRENVINDFAASISAGRICVNTPATQGAIGGTYNTLNPSFTLSCGTDAGNIFTDNITTTHLLNIHRVARRRPNQRWFDIPEKIWQDPDVEANAILQQYNRNF